MEKPKNLYVRPMDLKQGGGRMLMGAGVQGGGDIGREKDGTTVIA